MSVKSKAKSLWTLARAAVEEPPILASIMPIVRHPRSSNLDLAEPWWSVRAIRFLDEKLPANGFAFEWGSGGSTAWLSKRGMVVTSIESEEPWAERVSSACPDADVRVIPGEVTGSFRSEPQLRDRGKHFFDTYVQAIDDFPDQNFDVVIVDGICRVECAKRAASKVKPGGFVVIDDSEWDFLDECAIPFSGWEATRLRGVKRPDRSHEGVLTHSLYLSETSFYRKPS